MAEPIYKFFMARFLEAWYQYPRKSRIASVAKLNEALEKVGAKRPILWQLKLVLRSMVDCWSRGVPQHRGGPEVRRGPSGVKLVPILREYERVGH